jgi:two-component system chemotaxis response regulator CheY
MAVSDTRLNLPGIEEHERDKMAVLVTGATSPQLSRFEDYMSSPMTSPSRAPATLQLCRDALVSSGFTVDAVDSGIDGIIAARKGLLGLIVMDVQLRDVPGYEAIKWLRSIPALKSTPIIVLTAEAKDDAVLALTRTSPSLRKPVSLAAILRTIHEVLECPTSNL